MLCTAPVRWNDNKTCCLILYSLEGLLCNFDGRYNGPKLRAGESKLVVGGILRKLLSLGCCAVSFYQDKAGLGPGEVATEPWEVKTCPRLELLRRVRREREGCQAGKARLT